MARILYFGWARDCAGIEAEELEIPEGTTVLRLWGELVSRHPGLEACRSSSRVAVDARYASDESVVPAGAEIAIIPPVAGG